MSIQIKKLNEKLYVAELWHGKTGCAEDLTGSDIPGGYIRVVQQVYSALDVYKVSSAVVIAAPTSLWVSACLQAADAGVLIDKVVCPFASMPWQDPRIVPIAVSAQSSDEYLEKYSEEMDYVFFPRTAAAGFAAEKYLQDFDNTLPCVILATQAPQQA